MIKYFCFLGLIILNFNTGDCFAESIDTWVKKYSGQFDSDGTGKLLTSAHFLAEVPAADQPEVLAQILDQQSSGPHPNSNSISGACGTILQLRVPWSDHLKNSINALLENPDWLIRGCGLHLIALKEKETKKDVILAFQDDPDERIRISLMHDIEKWPDAGPIYQKFIEKHMNDPNYKESVETAKDSMRINSHLPSGQQKVNSTSQP